MTNTLLKAHACLSLVFFTFVATAQPVPDALGLNNVSYEFYHADFSCTGYGFGEKEIP